MRIVLAGALIAEVDQWVVTPAARARALGIKASQVNNLLAGRMEKLTLSTLVRVALHAGIGVRLIAYRPGPSPSFREAETYYTMRVALVMELCQELETWPGKQAAKGHRLGITAAQVSKLLSDGVDAFALGSLVRMATNAGIAMRMIVIQSVHNGAAL
jgi:predicted XRE-type DNA-binding protein